MLRRDGVSKPTLGIVPIVCTTAVAACVYRYEGAVAELDVTADIDVVQAAHKYGDCYRQPDSVPVVYRVKRNEYELRIALGNRYWPEFFLSAVNPPGTNLEIVGNEIVELNKNPDTLELQEARGIELTHVARLSRTPGRFRLVFQVQDRDHAVLGNETLPYEVKAIHCAEIDSL